jgi:hypothetical protein
MEVATIAAVGMIASGVATAGAAAYSGVQSARTAQVARRQYEEERNLAALQGLQDENTRRAGLQRALATNQALRAGRGLQYMTPGSEALEDYNVAEAEKDIGAAKLNTLRRVRRYDLAIEGESARETGGYLSAATGVIQGFGSAATGARRLNG